MKTHEMPFLNSSHGLRQSDRSTVSWVAGITLLASGFMPVDCQLIPLNLRPAGSSIATASEGDNAYADPKSLFDPTYDRSVSSYGKIKLNYYSASWPRVFQDVADSFEKEFIGDHLPAGRFSRNDMAEHSLKDAIRIINAEIEPQGFRLVEKRRYLILLETTLERPQVPASAKKPTPPPARNVQVKADENVTREVATASQRPAETDTRPPVRPNQVSNPTRQVSYQSSEEGSTVQQLSHVVEKIERWNDTSDPQVYLLRLKNVASKPTAHLLTSIFNATSNSLDPRNGVHGSIAIVDVGKANSLMIMASEADLASIIEIAVQIDSPIVPDSEFQIFRWRATAAMDVNTVIAEFTREQGSLASRSLVIASPLSNAIVVRACPSDLDAFQNWIKQKSAQLDR